MRSMTSLALILLALPLAACSNGDSFADAKALIAARCAACHLVPGVGTATGRVGPPLTGIANRQVLAGRFANTRDNMIRWIQHPQAYEPGTAMPETGLTPEQAGRIADYLSTLDKDS